MCRNLLTSILSSLLFNTAIAGFLTFIVREESFWVNLVFSQCIGLSIYAVNVVVMYRIANPQRWLVLALTFPGSIIFGVTLASVLTGVGSWSDPKAWGAVVIGLFFGGIGVITYLMSERIGKLDAEVKQHQLMHSEAARREAEAHLKLLQAQIEPHFLFNTLANVASLIDSDPPAARRLLDRLNDWLRVALARARSSTTTLGYELDMLENYLQILKVRFGDRLTWRVEASDAACNSVFPPMLLQPLVENAVRHGIETKLGGGQVRISAEVTPDGLCVTVDDDGAGLADELHSGTGLENIRARLAALYGEAGRLDLASNSAGGVTATLEIPR